MVSGYLQGLGDHALTSGKNAIILGVRWQWTLPVQIERKSVLWKPVFSLTSIR